MKFIKERKNGLLLVILSFSIIGSFSFYSKHAVSKEIQNSNDDGHVLSGEQAKQNEYVVYEENSQEANQNSPVSQEDNARITEASDKPDSGTAASNNGQNRCSDLKDLLKKYCGKNYDVKKCQKYLLETKDLARSDDQCKSLYKKYHFVKKKDDKKSDETVSAVDSKNITETLAISASGKSESHEISVQPGTSVIGLMNIGKIPYDTFSSGLLDNIDGKGKMSGNMSWMLYVCKGGECKLSSVGASECKLDNWDKVEWRFLDWTEITSWDSW
jgi:hypothetical protein